MQPPLAQPAAQATPPPPNGYAYASTQMVARINPDLPLGAPKNYGLPQLDGQGRRFFYASDGFVPVEPGVVPLLKRVHCDGELTERGGRGPKLFDIVTAAEAQVIVTEEQKRALLRNAGVGAMHAEMRAVAEQEANNRAAALEAEMARRAAESEAERARLTAELDAHKAASGEQAERLAALEAKHAEMRTAAEQEANNRAASLEAEMAHKAAEAAAEKARMAKELDAHKATSAEQAERLTTLEAQLTQVLTRLGEQAPGTAPAPSALPAAPNAEDAPAQEPGAEGTSATSDPKKKRPGAGGPGR